MLHIVYRQKNSLPGFSMSNKIGTDAKQSNHKKIFNFFNFYRKSPTPTSFFGYPFLSDLLLDLKISLWLVVFFRIASCVCSFDFAQDRRIAEEKKFLAGGIVAAAGGGMRVIQF